ncbi:hypothetical protein C5167_028026 [Papaver somniferum]|nr:hypothetical protein C5167_028026 [Papaver somniferum]
MISYQALELPPNFTSLPESFVKRPWRHILQDISEPLKPSLVQSISGLRICQCLRNRVMIILEHMVQGDERKSN